MTLVAELVEVAPVVRPPLKWAGGKRWLVRQCLVIEDTVAGVEAARGAGMKVLALAHSTVAETLSAADLVRNSLAETDLNEVLRILSR